MKLLYSFILGIFLLATISAQISISPSTISLNAYPGEAIEKDITITTDGNYAVYLTSQSQANITINYTSPLIVEKNKIVPVTFIFPADILPGVYAINLTGSIDIYVDTPSTIIQEVRSGGGIVYRNGTTKIIDNPADKKLIQELNNTIQELIKIPEETKEIEKARETIKLLIWILAAVILVGLIILGIKLFRTEKFATKINEEDTIEEKVL